MEVFVKNKRVASHARHHGRGQTVTRPEHMPRSHREHARWTLERLRAWAAQSGPGIERFMAELLQRKRHPAQGHSACVGLMRLGRSYGLERLRAACERAEQLGSFDFTTVRNILRNGQDRLPSPGAEEDVEVQRKSHGNIRGSEYYGGDDDDVDTVH